MPDSHSLIILINEHTDPAASCVSRELEGTREGSGHWDFYVDAS